MYLSVPGFHTSTANALLGLHKSAGPRSAEVNSAEQTFCFCMHRVSMASRWSFTIHTPVKIAGHTD